MPNHFSPQRSAARAWSLFVALCSLFSFGESFGQAPRIVQQPTSIVTTPGAAVSFSLMATGAPPLHYQWFFNGAAIVDATNTVLEIAGVQSSQEGSYDAWVTNNFGSVTSVVARLALDTDEDGMPDSWETLYQLDPNDAADADDDADSDDQTNLHEYLTGTDPTDPGSRFAIQIRQFSEGRIELEVPIPPGMELGTLIGCEYTDALDDFWFQLSFPGFVIGTNVTFTDFPFGASRRFYRVVALVGSERIYSANVVGYLNLQLPAGTNRIAIPFLGGESNVGSLLPVVPEETCLIKTNGESTCYSFEFLEWWEDKAMPLMPGEPFDLVTVEPFALTLLGEVPRVPIIMFHPRASKTPVGGSATLEVFALAKSSLTYQWQRDGSPVDFGTSRLLSLFDVGVVDAGDYSVVVSNSFGESVESLPARFIVSTRPTLVNPLKTGTNTFCLTVQATPGCSYQVEAFPSPGVGWIPLATILSTNNVFEFCDALANSPPHRLYRVRELP